MNQVPFRGALVSDALLHPLVGSTGRDRRALGL